MNEKELWVLHDLLTDALSESQENSKKTIASALAIVKGHLRPVPNFLPVFEEVVDRFELD